MLKINRALARRRDAILNGERADEGFTLIELLIVVLIIGVLAAIAIPVYLSTVQNSKDTSAKDAATGIVTAIGVWETTPGNSGLPSDLSDHSVFVLPGTSINVWYGTNGSTTYTVCTEYNGSDKYYVATASSSVVEASACTGGIATDPVDAVQVNN